MIELGFMFILRNISTLFEFQIGSECLACREQVAMMDFSYFCKLYMIGPDTQKAADWIFTNDTDVPFDQVVYTCLLNDSAGIEADLTVVPIRPGTGTMANPIFKVLSKLVFSLYFEL